MQDEHIVLPENMTEDMLGFLLEWFQASHKRPDVRALMSHT